MQQASLEGFGQPYDSPGEFKFEGSYSFHIINYTLFSLKSQPI
jgi:hypothetical protein